MRLRLSCLLFVSLTLPPPGTLAADVTLTVTSSKTIRTIAPGAIGRGAMWKQETLYPKPGNIRTDAEHWTYLQRLAKEGAPQTCLNARLRNTSYRLGPDMAVTEQWPTHARFPIPVEIRLPHRPRLPA